MNKKISKNDDDIDDINYDNLLKDAYGGSDFKVGYVRHEDSVSEILKFLKRDSITLDPTFQRDDVWDDVRRSEFIESIILDIPIPPLFVNVEEDGSFIIIDGRQRITAIRNFILGFGEDKKNVKFLTLKGLKILKELNGLKFDDEEFPQEFRNRVEDYKLLTYRVTSIPSSLVIYDIFKRLNTKGTPLYPQEIRNALYQGKATALLNRIAISEEFLSATERRINPKRMKDKEFILRMLAPIVIPIDEYPKNGNIDEYLKKALHIISHRFSEVEITNLEKRSKNILILAKRIFKDICFKSNPVDGVRRLNLALADAMSVVLNEKYDSLSKISEKQTNVVIKKYTQIFMDEKFITSIGRRAYEKDSFLYRVKKISQSLEG